MKEITEKLDKIIEEQINQGKTLVKQSILLDEHIRRTNLLEKKLEPVENHVKGVRFSGKLLLSLGGAAAAVLTFIRLFGTI